MVKQKKNREWVKYVLLIAALLLFVICINMHITYGAGMWQIFVLDFVCVVLSFVGMLIEIKNMNSTFF